MTNRNLAVRLLCFVIAGVFLNNFWLIQAGEAQRLDQMIYFHYILEKSGYALDGPVTTKGCKIASFFKKCSEKGEFLIACCFDNGSAERVLLWAEKKIPLENIKENWGLILYQIIEVRGEKLTPAGVGCILEQIEENCQKGGVQGFVWEEAMVIEVTSDDNYWKIKIEPFNPSSKPFV